VAIHDGAMADEETAPRESHEPEPRVHEPLVHDIHAHLFSARVEAVVADEPGRAAELRELARFQGEASVATNLQMLRDIQPALTLDGRLAHMDGHGIDVQVVSISPSQYCSWAEPAVAAAVADAAHHDLAELVAAAPDRFRAFGTVALQHPTLAAEQLTRAVREFGLDGVMIPTAAGGRDLSHPALDQLWSAAESVGAAVFIHPWSCPLGDRLGAWYLSNIVGNPTETAVALSHLIFGGVLDRHPDLRVCGAHGGGYLPHAIGRSDHGWRVRPESRSCVEAPSSYLSKLWFDTVVHDPIALRSLIDRVGADRVLLGSDFPFDMGDDDPLGALDATPGLTRSEREAISAANAVAFLGGSVGGSSLGGTVERSVERSIGRSAGVGRGDGRTSA
jgi:aminocarboxymuconate-semialdehyde decarboxylase